MRNTAEKKSGKGWKIFKAVIAVITAALMGIIWVGIYMQRKHIAELHEKCTESVMGICVDVTSLQKDRVVKKERHNGHHKRVITASYVQYTSKIEYTVDGVTYEIYSTHDNSPLPAKDEEIKVMYNPDDPKMSYIP